jgi:hypothetical protein
MQIDATMNPGSRGPCARSFLAPVLCAALVAGALAFSARPAPALSEIKREDPPSSQQTEPAEPSDESIERETLPPVDQVPVPDSTTAPPATEEPGQPTAPEENTAPDDDSQLDPNAPLPEVIYDLSRLPEPVKQKHQALMEACKSGDIEKLRPLLETGENGTQLSFGAIEGDPIAYLKQLSGDGEGREVLAILEEILSAGYVHLDAGTQNDMYVWPYFVGIPLNRLTPAQQVELFKILTANDYEEMKTYGSYIFYRLGITPDGKWSFFVAGD